MWENSKQTGEILLGESRTKDCSQQQKPSSSSFLCNIWKRGIAFATGNVLMVGQVTQHTHGLFCPHPPQTVGQNDHFSALSSGETNLKKNLFNKTLSIKASTFII
jgi:hypothetical protein